MPIPERSRIKEALVNFIAQSGGRTLSVTPRQAYRGLAQIFHLTEEDLNLQRNWDNLWRNEVRWARQDLVEEGILNLKDVSGYGSWQLNPNWNSSLREQTPGYKIASRSEEERIEEDLQGEGVFDPASLSDARDIILRAIVQRRGQDVFRRTLMTEYDGCCAITGERLSSVLEAAHIVPYAGKETNHVQNGILFRSDIHTLFDLHLIAIDAEYRVRISPLLRQTGYSRFDGQILHIPQDVNSRPSKSALLMHESECDF